MRLFDPTGIDSKNYKASYPELERTEEFEPINGICLIFIWWYANATSPIIDLDEEKRLEEALQKSGYKPDNIESFLELQFGEIIERAVEKMKSFIPGARYASWKALKNTFGNYIDILNRHPDKFVKTVKNGIESYEETDLATYSTVTAKLTAALPVLVEKLEEGFGVTLTASEEEEEGSSIIRNWHQDRQNK